MSLKALCARQVAKREEEEGESKWRKVLPKELVKVVDGFRHELYGEQNSTRLNSFNMLHLAVNGLSQGITHNILCLPEPPTKRKRRKRSYSSYDYVKPDSPFPERRLTSWQEGDEELPTLDEVNEYQEEIGRRMGVGTDALDDEDYGETKKMACNWFLFNEGMCSCRSG